MVVFYNARNPPEQSQSYSPLKRTKTEIYVDHRKFNSLTVENDYCAPHSTDSSIDTLVESKIFITPHAYS